MPAHEFQKCANCGAPVGTSPDGRALECAYCGATESQDVSPLALAASLRGDAKSAEQIFHHLATKLAKEFPDHTRVESSGFLTTSVTGFHVEIGSETLGMRLDGHKVVCTRKKVVRGIQLKNETLAIDAWVDVLSAGLAALANESAAGQAALQRLKGK